MDFELTETQLDLQKGILQFAAKEFDHQVIKNDDERSFPTADWHKCAHLGLLGLLINQKYGGSHLNLLTASISLEALAYGWKDNGLIHSIVTHNLCGLMIGLFGNDTQKERYLPSFCKGEAITAQAITEPDAGSDAMAMTCKAIKTSSGYVINGRKVFISNAPIADVVMVFAVSDSTKQKINRISCFIVEKATQGFHQSKPLEKMGLQTLQNGELVFEDCQIPHDHLLGKEGQGSMILGEILLYERILLSACHLGVMQRVIENSIAYANERLQFGQRIGKFQSISHKIADMKVNLETSKLILYKSAWLKDQKKRPHLETSIAKLFISEALQRVCLDALQIHGAYGYTKEFSIEQELRDSLAATIYSGTSEIHRNIISALIGL